MCFRAPKINTTVAPAPQRDSNSLLGRLFLRRAKGTEDTIKTSPLGDVGFGQNVSRATVLGSTTPSSY